MRHHAHHAHAPTGALAGLVRPQSLPPPPHPSMDPPSPQGVSLLPPSTPTPSSTTTSSASPPSLPSSLPSHPPKPYPRKSRALGPHNPIRQAIKRLIPPHSHSQGGGWGDAEGEGETGEGAVREGVRGGVVGAGGGGGGSAIFRATEALEGVVLPDPQQASLITHTTHAHTHAKTPNPAISHSMFNHQPAKQPT